MFKGRSPKDCEGAALTCGPPWKTAERASDEDLLRAAELGRIVFTQDVHFLALADKWRRVGRDFAGVIYAHRRRATIGQIVADLQLVSESSTADDLRNAVLFLPL